MHLFVEQRFSTICSVVQFNTIHSKREVLRQELTGQERRYVRILDNTASFCLRNSALGRIPVIGEIKLIARRGFAESHRCRRMKQEADSYYEEIAVTHRPLEREVRSANHRLSVPRITGEQWFRIDIYR